MGKLIVRRQDGSLVEPGDTMVDFRGDTAELLAATRPTVPGKAGKVYVHFGSHRSELYATCFDVTVHEVVQA